MKGIPLGPAGETILCDTSTGRPRPWIPASCRRKIFDIIHRLSHPSGRTTARLLSEKFIWPGIKKETHEWARTCINFQSSARYFLTIVDCFTRWLEATLMTEATTHACAKALLSSWISHFGVPDDITMDPGSAFLSEIWLSLANLMGTTLHSTTAYSPAANAMVERAHRTLKEAQMARCTDEHWKAQLGLHTATRADGEPSFAENDYGEALTFPR
ncbi:uncharacterized protein [Palaemon carinicauda]|uniref:uncharacterized protein n=1 Tax=Palaemon carinicauda TaxID=392227 RepID=UPI0035B580B3